MGHKIISSSKFWTEKNKFMLGISHDPKSKFFPYSEYLLLSVILLVVKWMTSFSNDDKAEEWFFEKLKAKHREK